MRKIIIAVLALLINVMVYAQPCMELWRYRTPITIDNLANPKPLVDYQLKVIVATDTLISAGEMKADGGDIRISNSAGVEIPFWIENYTINTDSTAIWINVDNIPPNSTIDIYMFYGNVNANSVADGDATFLLYDNFDGTALDFGKWTFCGGGNGGTIPVVSNGEVTFSSLSGLFSHSITSLETFSGALNTEMSVNSFNVGPAALGYVAASKNGYAMAVEDQAAVNHARLVSINPVNSASDSCLDLQNQTPVNSVALGGAQGLWSFTWSAPNEQIFSWDNNSETRHSYIDSAYFNEDRNVFLGSFYNTGSVSVDYIYTRKYSPIVPTYSLASRTELVDVVDATTNAPICKGDTLKLFAPSFAGAVYSWIGPNGFISTDQNPIIEVSDYVHVGQYVVSVSAPTGCSVVSDAVMVKLDSAPDAGTFLIDTTICMSLGEGTLDLKNITGNVIYWESANTDNGPWNTIANTSKTLDYNNLVSTQYYRAIVESGTCGVDTSNMATISIDLPSDGGHITGGNVDACYGYNSGYLRATDYTGSIVMWQSSPDFGTHWNAIATTNNEIEYKNLSDTTWYRMLVKNGVCDSSFSDTAVVFVQPLPVVDFISDSVCQTSATSLKNLTTISPGTILNYEWNFTEGNSSNIQDPKHTFENHGSYNVYLKATSDKGCVDSTRRIVVVHPNPTANFTFSDVCDTTTVEFTNLSTIATGSIADNRWNYGDDETDNLLNANHRYGNDGDYDVHLKVVSEFGCSDSVDHIIRILPRAQVSYIGDSVCFGEEIAFNNTTSTIDDSTTYSWSFDDGTLSDELNPEYQYAQHGTYSVVLQATTFGMCVSSYTDTVIVYPKPEASFSFTNQCKYDEVAFENASTVAYGSLSQSWDFGDSITSTESSVSHLYEVASHYFVSLNVSSEYGCTDDTTRMTQVFPLPNASFVIGNVCQDTLTPITNTSTVTSGDMTYSWDFGNDDVSDVETPDYVYPNDGTYTIRLIASSNYNCLDTLEQEITIHPIPKTNFIADPVCFTYATDFINTTTIDKGFINSYLWNYNDKNYSIDTEGTHLYASDGKYDVWLRAESDKGCLKDTTIEVLVHPKPEVAFSFENECIYNQVQFYNASEINSGMQTYSWQLGDDSTSTEESPSHIYESFGLFPVQLKANSDQGCTDSSAQIIQIYSLPLVNAGLDTLVSYGYSTPLMGISPEAVEVSWTPALTVDNSTSLLTMARPLVDTVYTLQVTDINGCIDYDEVAIQVEKDYKLLVSNAVTPNGDGKNDTWKIFNASSFSDIHIRLYDKWGLEMFSANDYTDEWDGVLDLEELPNGTYYYVINFDGSDRIYKGALTILR